MAEARLVCCQGQSGSRSEEKGEDQTGEVLAVPLLARGRELAVPLLTRASLLQSIQRSARQAMQREVDLAVPVRLLGRELAVPLPTGDVAG